MAKVQNYMLNSKNDFMAQGLQKSFIQQFQSVKKCRHHKQTNIDGRENCFEYAIELCPLFSQQETTKHSGQQKEHAYANEHHHGRQELFCRGSKIASQRRKQHHQQNDEQELKPANS